MTTNDVGVRESHEKRVVQAGADSADAASSAIGLSIADPPVQPQKKPRWCAPQKVRKPRRKIPKWMSPMHWDLTTGELFGARPVSQPFQPTWKVRTIPQPIDEDCAPPWQCDWRTNGLRFSQEPTPWPSSSYPTFRPSKFLVTGTKSNEVIGTPEAVGGWVEQEYVPKNLRTWVESQERHTNDQNILEARRHRVTPTSGYTGSRRVDFPKSPRIECNCVSCLRLAPRVWREAIALYVDSFGYPHTPSKHHRTDFCVIRYARLAEFVERVEAARKATEELRDRFNQDPRTIKINKFLAENRTPIAMSGWDNNRPQKPRVRQTGGMTWFLAKGFIEEPVFRNLETPMTNAERKQRSRELAELKADQEVDNASGGAAGPGRYLEGADAGKGLLVSGGYGATKLTEVDSMHNSNVGKVKPRGNAPDTFEDPLN